MASGEDYIVKAAEFRARAEAETNPKARDEFEHLARAYLRLAGQAKRNTETDITTSRRRQNSTFETDL